MIVIGAAALFLGLLMPAHLRAVDPQVLLHHGAAGKSLVAAAAETAAVNPAVAKIHLITAENLRLAGTDVVVENLRATAADRSHSRTVLEQLEAGESGRIQTVEVPVLTALRKKENRTRLAASLHSAEAKQILRTRGMTNLLLFASANSAAGLPLEVAVLTSAFLMEQRAFAPALPLRAEVLRLASGGDLPQLEELYLSIFALAKRLSSEQIIALIADIPTPEVLHAITGFIQEHRESATLVFSAVTLSNDGRAVAKYLARHPAEAEEDFSFALKGGVNALQKLLASEQPIYRSGFYNALADDPRLRFIFRPLLGLSAQFPALALLVKFALIGLGGFLLACALKFGRIAESSLYHTFPQFTLARRVAFSGFFVLLAIILGEPYLAQGEPAPATRIHWTFPVLAANAPPVPSRTQTPTPMLDQHTILAIVTFLLLQGLIYGICLVKLAEIRKQSIPSATKIKLLENEDNLFDGGLYCGLFGTAASLILLTLGVIKPSLVAAYSSTLFGILFVALLKIGHVRPYKRRLLLETSEPNPAQHPAPNPFA